MRYQYTHVPIPGGGYVTGFACHPTTPGILYARTDIGGSYRYDPDSGRWLSLTEHVGMGDLAETFPIALALDPHRPDRLCIACGDGRSWWGGPAPEDVCGILCISENRGDTFVRKKLPCYIHGNLPGRGTGPRLVVSPADTSGNTLFYASQRDGLFITRDLGDTWAQTDICGERYLTLVWVSPEGQTIVVGTAGVTSGTQEHRGHSLYASTDAGATWQPLNEPAGTGSGSKYPGLVAQRIAFDGTWIYITMAHTGVHNYVTELGYSCDSGDLLGGRILRYRLQSDGSLSDYEDITPEAVSETELPYGFGGISCCASCPGLIAASTLCRQSKGGEILYISKDFGRIWSRALDGLETGDLRFHTPYMKPAYNGGVSLLHWMSDVLIDPFDPDTVWFNSGTGVFRGSRFTHAVRSFSDHCDGIEETVHLNLYSPPAGPVQLIDILGDLGGFAFTDITKPCENSFADDDGNRYITCLNADYPDGIPALFAVTARGNWTGRTTGGLILTRDSGAHFRRLPLPYGLSERMDALCHGIEHPNVNVGWTAVSADGQSIVLGLADGNQLPADCIALTRDEGATWTKVSISTSSGKTPERMKVFSDRVDPDLFYGFGECGRFYVSRDGGLHFQEEAAGLPEVEFGLVDCANQTELRGDSGFAGVFLMALGDAGLWRLTYDREKDLADAKQLSAAGDVVYRLGLGRHPAEPGYIGCRKSFYVCGVIGGVYGFFRSDDQGATWERVNDDRHQFGEINTVSGDARVPGRFYIGSGSFGVICGEEV